jgi:hypothetical protein
LKMNKHSTRPQGGWAWGASDAVSPIRDGAGYHFNVRIEMQEHCNYYNNY